MLNVLIGTLHCDVFSNLTTCVGYFSDVTYARDRIAQLCRINFCTSFARFFDLSKRRLDRIVIHCVQNREHGAASQFLLTRATHEDKVGPRVWNSVRRRKPEVTFAAEERLSLSARSSASSRDSVPSKNVPYGWERPTWLTIMRARGRAFFCGECRRAPRVGCRRRVDESRAAGKPRSTRSGSGDRRARERPFSGRGREHSRAFGYLYIFCFQPTRVAACLVAVPGSTFLRGTAAFHRARFSVSPLRVLFFFPFLSFSSYVSSPRWLANKRVILSSPAPVTHRG